MNQMLLIIIIILNNIGCQKALLKDSIICKSLSFDRITETGDTIYNSIEREVIIYSDTFIHNYWRVTPVINKKLRITKSDTFIINEKTVSLISNGQEFKYFNKKSFETNEIIVVPSFRKGGTDVYYGEYYFLKPDTILNYFGTNIFRYKVFFKSIIGSSMSEIINQNQPTINEALEYGEFMIHPVLGTIKEDIKYDNLGGLPATKYNFSSEIIKCANRVVLMSLE